MADEGVKLTAFRPEAFRFQRLAKVLSDAEQAALDAGKRTQWSGALLELNDAKGDLTAIWRSQDDIQSLAGFIDRAWLETGESEPAVHQLSDGSSSPVSPLKRAPPSQMKRKRSGIFWRILASAALTLSSPVAASGLSIGCYAWGRYEVARMRAADPLATERYGVPMPWRDGLWSLHGAFGAFTLVWMILLAVFVLRARQGRAGVLMSAIPTLAFVAFAVETLRMAYTCNIF